jgi:hypothetical protein
MMHDAADIEGSTQLWERLNQVGAACSKQLSCACRPTLLAAVQGVMNTALSLHHALIRAAAARHAGYECGTEGGEWPVHLLVFSLPGSTPTLAGSCIHLLLLLCCQGRPPPAVPGW